MGVVWTVAALNQLDRIQDFIARDNPAAAHRLASSILSRTNAALAENPMIGRPGRVAETRELVISGTAYLVVYRIRRNAEVLAVVHGAREWPGSFAN